MASAIEEGGIKMNYYNEKLNIKIENFEETTYQIKEDIDEGCIELYHNDVLCFCIYRNAEIELSSHNSIKLYDKSFAYLYDNSSAELCDNSSAGLYDNSSAELHSNSSAELHSNSSAKLHDNSSAELYGNSSAYLYDNSFAKLYGKSSAELYNQSSAHLYEYSSVELYNNSSAELHDNSSAKLHDNSSTELHSNSSAELHSNSSAKLHDNSSAELHNFSTATKKSSSCQIKTGDNFFGEIIEYRAIFTAPQDMVVYKKIETINGSAICKLRIDKGQKFQSENHNKCRTNKAFVLDIYNPKTNEKYKSGYSSYNNAFTYTVGKYVYPNSYDENINECSNGIHFFLMEREAIKYE